MRPSLWFRCRIVKKEQCSEFSDLFDQLASDEESECATINSLLYSTKPVSPFSAEYPRLLLPSKFQAKVIDRCHVRTGHQAANKTLDRVRDGYVWPKMRKIVASRVRKCPL